MVIDDASALIAARLSITIMLLISSVRYEKTKNSACYGVHIRCVNRPLADHTCNLHGDINDRISPPRCAAQEPVILTLALHLGLLFSLGCSASVRSYSNVPCPAIAPPYPVWQSHHVVEFTGFDGPTTNQKKISITKAQNPSIEDFFLPNPSHIQ